MVREPTVFEVGMAWYNGLTREQRQYWHEIAKSARPVDAYRAYSNFEDGKRDAKPQ